MEHYCNRCHKPISEEVYKYSEEHFSRALCREHQPTPEARRLGELLKKYGYKVADTDGFQAIVWKPFSKDAQAPRWMKKVKSPSVVPGKVTVTSFCHGWCPAQNLALERAKRAVEQINEKDRVIFQQVDTFDRNNLSEWGLSDALFIDDHQVRTGPPPSYDSIRKIIEKKVKRLR